jgi:hypothetical protein
MSQFLLVIPEGWTQLDWQHITNNVPNMSGPAVASMIQSGVLSDIEAGLKEAGIIPPKASLVDAKLIDDTYFMVKLG